MNNKNIFSNKFDLFWTTSFSYTILFIFSLDFLSIDSVSL